MYAIVKTGGKQYRVEQGQSLLVERLPAEDGAKVSLQPLLYVDGDTVLDSADELGRVNIEARARVGRPRDGSASAASFTDIRSLLQRARVCRAAR